MTPKEANFKLAWGKLACVAGHCGNQAYPEMPGVFSIAKAFPEMPNFINM